MNVKEIYYCLHRILRRHGKTARLRTWAYATRPGDDDEDGQGNNPLKNSPANKYTLDK